jgi:NADPH:quinone reductase-like Zn-dependent oxidoreductase
MTRWLPGRKKGKKMEVLGHRRNQKDLTYITDLFGSGRVTPVIDKVFTLAEVPDALRYLGDGHAIGKVVVRIEPASAESLR